MAWYNNNWQYRVKVTIDNTKVPGDLDNYTAYVDLSLLPSSFFSTVKSDGGDIRITTSDGTTEVPTYVNAIDTGAETGYLFFRYPGTLSSTVDTDIYIYYGNSGASTPAVTATYGRNNTFQNFMGFWDLEQDPSGSAPQFTNLNGTGNDLTAQGTWDGSEVGSGPIGQYIETGVSTEHWVSGGAGMMTVTVGFNVRLSYGGWVYSQNSSLCLTKIGSNQLGGRVRAIAGGTGSVDVNALSNNGGTLQLNNDTGDFSAGTAWRYLANVHQPTSNLFESYGDGVLIESDSVSTSGDWKTYQMLLGRIRTTDTTLFTDGQRFSLAWARWSANSDGNYYDDLHEAEYANQNNPDTFYTIGSEENVPVISRRVFNIS